MKTPAFLFFAVLALAIPAVARAGEHGPPVHVAGGLVTVAPGNDGALLWRAEWIVAADDAADFAWGDVSLAAPLPEGETLAPAPGLEPLYDGGRIVAVRVHEAALQGRRLRATFLQPTVDDGRLGAPLAAGTAVQIIDGDLGGGTNLEIDRAGISLRPGPGRGAREEARRLTGFRAHAGDSAAYVRGVDVDPARGLRGRVVTPRQRAHGASIAVSLVFVALVGAMLAWWRRVRRAAETERADALLAAELDGLDALASRRR